MNEQLKEFICIVVGGALVGGGLVYWLDKTA